MRLLACVSDECGCAHKRSRYVRTCGHPRACEPARPPACAKRFSMLSANKWICQKPLRGPTATLPCVCWLRVELRTGYVPMLDSFSSAGKSCTRQAALHRVVQQGVDMGRAFPVFMFCVAMGPLNWCLNQLPPPITTEGYVDDCAIAGSADHFQWLSWRITAASDGAWNLHMARTAGRVSLPSWLQRRRLLPIFVSIACRCSTFRREGVLCEPVASWGVFAQCWVPMPLLANVVPRVG